MAAYQAYIASYAVESFHNDREYGSQAIVKHDICRAVRQYWYKPSHFPSEAFFIPRRADGAAEDDGIVVFTALDGVHNKSYLLVLDGQDFGNTLVEQELPVVVPFTTHGEFFDGLVGKDEQRAEQRPHLQ